MRIVTCFLAAAFSFACSSCPPVAPSAVSTPADTAAAQSAGPVELTDFQIMGASDAVKFGQVPVGGQTFQNAYRAEVMRALPNPWDVQLGAKTKAAIQSGDVLRASFAFRLAPAAEQPAEGQSEFVVELSRDPWTKATTRPIAAGSEWKTMTVAFQSPQDFAPGEAQVLFRLGYRPQTLEVANVSLHNFKQTKTLAEVQANETKLTYAGREPDAPWRKEAEARIESLRKADLEVIVKHAGKVAPEAEVKIEQLDHAFGIGTCAPAAVLLDPSQERFREVVTQYFNTVTLENDLKWVALAGDWGPSFKLEDAKRAVAWLDQQDIDVRGHVMVWPGWKELPKYLRAFENDKPKLKAEVEKRIREIGTAMKGTLIHWDVLNEPFANHDLMDLLGEDVMVSWFKQARATDPKAKLFLNDYGILPGGAADNAHRQHFDKTIAYLLDQKAPLDGIGMQGHFETSLTAAPDLLAQLDRYGRFGKPIWITEYDLVLDDEALQADYTRDLYTTAFSHPAVEGVVMWGFKDDLHWKKNAVMFRQDWSLKPAGKVFQELFQEKWRTRATATSDAAGRVAIRGFLGKYRVEATLAGKRGEAIAELDKKGTRIIVSIP